MSEEERALMADLISAIRWQTEAISRLADANAALVDQLIAQSGEADEEVPRYLDGRPM